MLDNVLSNQLKAIEFATMKHAGHLRKYTGEPYIVHCLRVAKILTDAGIGEPCISVAILHDTVEDTDTTFEELESNFGTVIAGLVMDLTDPPLSFGNRAARKAFVRDKMQKISPHAKTVKCADIIDNMTSIIEHDPHFAKVFMAEILDTLPALVGAEPKLHDRVFTMAVNWEETGKCI